VLEGADRVGKDVQAKILTERLCRSGIATERFATPDYGTDVGRAISHHLRTHRLEGREPSEAMELECLLAACRYQVSDKVRKALSCGSWAVCSRWWPSALAYGTLDGVASSRWLTETYSELLRPNLVVLLSSPPGATVVRLGEDLYEGHHGRQQEISHSYRDMWRDLSSEESKLGPSGEDRTSWSVLEVGGLDEIVVADQLWALVTSRYCDEATQGLFGR
jgi:thymidylate kinase